MANVSIARRYARALLDVASEAQKLDRFGDQLRALARALDQHPELVEVMVNPAYSRAQRMAVARALFAALGGFDPEVTNFVQLLVDRNRMGSLQDVARLYSDLADARAGRVRGKVISAVALSPDALARVGQILEAITQRKVVLESTVDPAILGGISAQVGSVLYDGSLRTQLEELRRSLRQA